MPHSYLLREKPPEDDAPPAPLGTRLPDASTRILHTFPPAPPTPHSHPAAPHRTGENVPSPLSWCPSSPGAKLLTAQSPLWWQPPLPQGLHKTKWAVSGPDSHLSLYRGSSTQDSRSRSSQLGVPPNSLVHAILCKVRSWTFGHCDLSFDQEGGQLNVPLNRTRTSAARPSARPPLARAVSSPSSLRPIPRHSRESAGWVGR